MNHFGLINQIYCKYFGLNPPSRACVEISNDYLKDKQVQIDCIALRNGKDLIKSGRDVLHVQSISKWAPTCIGPYSQANVINGIIFLAGMFFVFIRS